MVTGLYQAKQVPVAEDIHREFFGTS